MTYPIWNNQSFENNFKKWLENENFDIQTNFPFSKQISKDYVIDENNNEDNRETEDTSKVTTQ